MARFVMISIPDNADADAFVEAVKRHDVIFGYKKGNDADHIISSDDTYSYTGLADAEVEAVWAKPTKYCDCPDYAGVSTPSLKFNWMVHAKCGKPRKGSMMHPKDLTRIDEKPQHIPYYLGFRADSKGWRLTKEDVDGPAS